MTAGREATPWDYGEALDTLIEMGWGEVPAEIPPDASVRTAGEGLTAVLREKTEELADQLLSRWETLGHVFRL